LSFSSLAKDEIVKQKLKGNEEKRALLSALLHTAGSMTLGRGVGIQFISENPNVAQLAASLASGLYDVESSVSESKQDRLSARNCVVRLSGPGCMDLLNESGCFTVDETLGQGHIPNLLLRDENCVRAFIKGSFLGAGSVVDPKKGYHLEIVCRHERFAIELAELVNSFGLNARYTVRKGAYILYVKEGEKVADFLTLVGAMNSTLEFEQERILRDLSNNLNRQRNFEDANMHKAALASAQQLLDIEVILSEQGIDSLSPKIREAVELRLNNPEASLSELAELCAVSKSGLNHRFQKINEIANNIRLQRGENI